MRIGRCLSPAAAPLSVTDLIRGLFGVINPDNTIASLKQSLCKQFNKKHCYLVSSGKAAITLSLQALSKLFPDRNEVIIPAFNCYSVPSAIIRAGLVVRPCDIDPDTLQMKDTDLLNILSANNKVLAILPTHLFGLPADVDHLRTIVNDKNITIIEDAAQAMGSNYQGTLLGTKGDIGIFSLARGKTISAGEGGIIITDSDETADKISEQIDSIPVYTTLQLANIIIQSIALTWLIHPNLFWIPKLMPFLKLGETVFDPDFSIRKISWFQAGLINRWSDKISWLINKRTKWVSLYSQYLSGIDGLSIFTDSPAFSSMPLIRFPIVIKDKQAIEQILFQSNRLGLGISKTYPDSIDSLLQVDIRKENVCTDAKTIAETILTLPCHPMIREMDFFRIVGVIRSVMNK